MSFFHILLSSSRGGIPEASDALFHLNGVIEEDSGSYYFSDNTGNGRRFLITNKDFPSDWTIGFPYKSKATISAPVGDAVLIAADVNNYLYDTNGDPNEIPVVSLFQDVDYEHKLFCRHRSQVLDENNEELIEPRVVEVVLYATVKAGNPLINCQEYFDVPVEVTSNVIWISKDGNNTTGTGTKANPWLTLTKADGSGTAGHTVYCKTGTYLEAGTFAYLTLNKTLHYKFIGLCRITTSDTRVLRLIAGNSTMEGAILDGLGTATYGLDVFAANDKASTFTRCLITGVTTGLVNGSSAIETLTFADCIFIGYEKATRATQDIKAASPSITGSYFVNCQVFLYRIDNVYTYNRFHDNDKDYCIQLVATGLTAFGNDITYQVNGIGESTAFTTGKTVDVRRNTFTLSAETGTAPEGKAVRLTGTVNAYIKNNRFISLATSFTTNPAFVHFSVSATYVCEIDENILISKSTTDFSHISAIGIGVKIRNNYSWSNTLIGTQITLGSEGSSTGVNSNSIVTGNTIVGFKLENPSGTGSTHALFIGGGIDIKTAYNRISFSDLGIVVKTGTAAQAYTTEGVYSNVIEECRVGIFCRGVAGINVFNNTIYHSDTVYGQAFTQGIIVDENTAMPDTQNSENVICKNNIIDVRVSVGVLVFFDAFAGANGCIAENNVLNGGQYLLADGVNYSSLATAQAASKLLNCVVQDPLLSELLIPASPLTIGEDLGDSYDTGLDVSTNWGSSTTVPVVVTRDQVADGAWEVGAYVQR